MAKPVFRNPDKVPTLPFREWIRQNKPRGDEGYVAEDIDLLLRVYGSKYHSDKQGFFMVIELKYGKARMGKAQLMTFGLVDYLLKSADPGGRRYKGFYEVNYDNDDWTEASFTVNGVRLTSDEFLEDFLDFHFEKLPKVKPYRFPDFHQNPQRSLSYRLDSLEKGGEGGEGNSPGSNE